MVQLVALIKPFRARAVLEALDSLGLRAATVREVMGFGRQKERLSRYLGSEYDASFIPKVELTVLVADDQVEPAIKAIVGCARTGRMGDGKILVVPCLDAVVEW
jgi:nitrogen regulatory protein PII